MSQAPAHSDEPVVFDPSAPGFDIDPSPTYKRLLDEAPVYYWQAAHLYVVSRFEDVTRLLRDPRLSTDPASVGYPRPEDTLPADYRMLQENSLFRIPPKDHARIRRAVTPAFTPRAIERLRPEVQRIVDEALAPFDGKEEIDFVPVAESIPLRVIASILQIPPAYDDTFRKFGQAYVLATDPRWTREQLLEILEPIPAGVALLRSIIAERRQNLGDDLLSTLIRAEQAGDKLTEEEMIALLAGLIPAGAETTAHFLCRAVLNLLRDPERIELVRREPEVLRTALEEVLRHDGFGKGGIPRFATEDIEVAGTKIAKGSMIMCLISAAARDPRAFPDADKFDMRRQPAEGINYGAGPHFCLGVSLVRLEGDVTISTMIRRYPHMRLISEPAYRFHPFMRQMQSLRVGLSA